MLFSSKWPVVALNNLTAVRDVVRAPDGED